MKPEHLTNAAVLALPTTVFLVVWAAAEIWRAFA